MASDHRARNIVIIGGGIIGSTTAYFLSHHPSFNKEKDNVTLLEATKIAGGASGKAGGLLALWAYPACIVPLSYRLHKELAHKHGGEERWGYRAVHCGQVDAKVKANGISNGTSKAGSESVPLQKRTEKATGVLRAAGVPKDLDWVDAESLVGYDEMGTPSTTAQVHPYQFTTSMASLAEEAGAKVIFGSCTKIGISEDSVTGISYKDKRSGELKELKADTVVITAGPWTRTIYPPAPISALRAHSVTIRPSRPVSAYALFTSIEMPGRKGRRGQTVTPEIYARPNQEIYACGEGDHLIPLPTSTDLVQVDESLCQDIIDHVNCISEEVRNGEVTARQACYLPNVTSGGGPLIGETGVKGLLMGAGHTCWGIQNAPGTGKCLSELIWEGSISSASLESLEPKRYM